MKKKVLIAGGSGLIGSAITNELKKKDYDVILISRTKRNADPKNNIIKTITWDNIESEDLEKSVALINLAGASIAGKRWTDEYKKVIIDSRVQTTRKIVGLIIGTKNPPQVYINASAVGIYGDRGEEIITEDATSGSGFLAVVCRKWENEAKLADGKTRTVISRIGVVLDKNEGALAKMMLPFKMYVGGPLGSGSQYLSWIHIDEIAKLFVYAIENDTLRGEINFVSPNSVTMNEFAKTIGIVMNRPAFMKVPEFALKIMLGEQAEMLTNSQRVKPKKLLNSGYKFEFPDLSAALENIIKQ